MVEFITAYITITALWIMLAVIIFLGMLAHRAIETDKYEKK